jgi:hypothetical protein
LLHCYRRGEREIANHRGFSAAVAELQVTLRDLAFAFAEYQGAPSGAPQSSLLRNRFSGGLCDEASSGPRLKAAQRDNGNGTPEGVP